MERSSLNSFRRQLASALYPRKQGRGIIRGNRHAQPTIQVVRIPSPQPALELTEVNRVTTTRFFLL